jgi:methylmalonyl-CoA/ethylmalonyl-CoA epimerase
VTKRGTVFGGQVDVGPAFQPELDSSGPDNKIMRLHHVGFVVQNIRREAANFAQSIGAYWDEAVFHDPLQNARVTFLRPLLQADALIELVEPGADGSPVGHFLEKGGGLHHLCYEVGDLDAHLKAARLRGAVVVRRPVPAVAFANRRIAWALTKEKLLVEYLEREQFSTTA